MNEFIRYEQQGRIVTLTMNRPEERNAIGSHADCEALVDAVERAAADPQVAVLVLTGAGSAFSAGGNLKGMRDRDGIGPLDSPLATRSNYIRGIQRIPLALWNCELPTIAAINGHAIGAGLDLACMCDIRIAAQGAKLASSFIKMGIVPGDGGAYFLPRAVGLAKAAEMMFTGDAIGSDDALACGLGSGRVPDGAIAHIVFNNPDKLNAISLEMWQGLGDAVEGFEADPEVRAIVLYGAGDKAFVAGADVSKYEEERMGDNAQEHYAQTGERALK